MTCQWVRQNLTGYVDQQLRAGMVADLERHLLACGACHQEYEYLARLNSPLRDLPGLEPPPGLATEIRVQWSQQVQASLWERWQVHLANLMRPVALPAAGGLLTALLLFGALLPAVVFTRSGRSEADVPTGFTTGPRFKTASVLPMYEEDLLVEAWVDEQGKITRYEVLNPAPSGDQVGKELHYQVTNVLLTTLFEPATLFGQPTSARVVFSLRRINIRG